MIRFLCKVAAQRLLGAAPGGSAVYAWAQRNVTRSFALTEETLADQETRPHLIASMLREACPEVDIPALAPHLDIGTGWLPMIPLGLRQQGLRGQWLVDVRSQLRPDPAIAAVRRLNARRGTLPALATPADSSWPAFRQWLRDLDIHDIAPATPPYELPTGGFGLVTCWQVLQYPPVAAVRAMHREAARLLRPGGLYAAEIWLDDQYASSDPALSRFNFLRYSHRNWARWFDNPMTPLNRLRLSDHATLIEDLPFDRLVWRAEGGGAAELAELDRCPIHRDFAAYSPEDLATTRLTFVLRRRG